MSQPIETWSSPPSFSFSQLSPKESELHFLTLSFVAVQQAHPRLRYDTVSVSKAPESFALCAGAHGVLAHDHGSRSPFVPFRYRHCDAEPRTEGARALALGATPFVSAPS
jgi:hypothetical protein